MSENNLNPSRTYFRKEIDDEFKLVKAAMHAKAVARGNGVALYKDCYTGKILRGGDPYDYEHIISSNEVYMKYRATHSNEQIAKIVNCPENVAVTLREINLAKGKKNLLSWLTDECATRYGIDKNLAISHYKAALKSIERTAALLK